MRYIRAVHSPTPRISVSAATTASSLASPNPSRVRSRSPSRNAAAASRRYSTLVPLRPASRRATSSAASTSSGVGAPPSTSTNRSWMAAAEAVESCWFTMEVQRRANSSAAGSIVSRPCRSISRAMVESSRRVAATRSFIGERLGPETGVSFSCETHVDKLTARFSFGRWKRSTMTVPTPLVCSSKTSSV